MNTKPLDDPYFTIDIVFPQIVKKGSPPFANVDAEVWVRSQNGYEGIVAMEYECAYVDGGTPCPDYEENGGNRRVNLPESQERQVDVPITYERNVPFTLRARGTDGYGNYAEDTETYYPEK